MSDDEVPYDAVVAAAMAKAWNEMMARIAAEQLAAQSKPPPDWGGASYQEHEAIGPFFIGTCPDTTDSA